MSRCISRSGEFSDHELPGPDGEFTCARCFVTDGEALYAALQKARTKVDSLVCQRDAALSNANHFEAALSRMSSLYREAVGVPESKHQQRRMDQIAEACETAQAECDAALGEVAALREQVRTAKAEALRETERAWQYNGWADVLLPKTGNPIADAQAVTEWLRARADEAEAAL